MKKCHIFILFGFLTSSIVQSQVTEEWITRYNSPINGDDIGAAIIFDDSGNVYITGSSLGNGTGSDYITIKYNSSGTEKWVQRYNGPGNITDNAQSIAIDKMGNVFVTGRSTGNGSNYDYTTIKYNSLGVQQWIQIYNEAPNGWDQANAIAVDDSGNVYVTGMSEGWGTSQDYATIKYNSSGVQQWIKRYNGPGNNYDAARSIFVDRMGNVYVTGQSWGSGTYLDYATIKYNPSGDTLWVRRYAGPGYADVDNSQSITVDNSGNVYVTGTSTGNGTGYDYVTMKYDSAGATQWVQRYGGPGNYVDEAYKLAIDAEGNVYVTGRSSMNGIFDDFATVKYNSWGVRQWVQKFNGPADSTDYASSISVDALGNVYVTGTSIGIGTSDDYTTIKYNSAGVQQWVQRYNGPGNGPDRTTSIAIDSFGNVYVTGTSFGSGTNFDCTTIKYSQPTGIEIIPNNIPEHFSLSQNYPNPFNPSTNISYQLPVSGQVTVCVYDVLGNKVSTLVDEYKPSGSYEIEFNGKDLSSGIYFYLFRTGQFIQTKKMILIK